MHPPLAMRSDDFTVKISMLFVDTFFQIVVTFMLLPFDVVPGFGAHDTISDSWTAFHSGLTAIFQNGEIAAYMVTFLLGFASSHLAFAYLNHYNATFTPITMILASPITNVLLIIIPSWNSHKSTPVVWSSCVSAVLMGGAAILFGRFVVARKQQRIAENLKF